MVMGIPSTRTQATYIDIVLKRQSKATLQQHSQQHYNYVNNADGSPNRGGN